MNKRLKIMHLTSLTKSDDVKVVYKTIIDAGYEYIKHTFPIQENEFFLNEIDLIVKDRYSLEFSDKILAQIPVLSFTPAWLPFNAGAHSVLSSIINNTPIGGTIFFLNSNKYQISILDRFFVQADPLTDTLRTLYDRIYNEIYQVFSKNFATYINNFDSLKEIDKFYNHDAIKIGDGLVFQQILDTLPNGLDTFIKNINLTYSYSK